MRVVHIGYKYGLNDTGGAAIAATRLHNALLKQGIESHYICVWKCEDGENVHELPARRSFLRPLFFALTKITRCIWNFTSCKKSIPLNIIPLFGLERLLAEIKPDVVHIHWINADVMSFEQLARLTSKVVINLHDLFMINICSPHPGNDRRYIEGVTRGNASCIERWLFERKRACVRRVRPIFVGPSEWACECARQSIIGKNFDVYLISNLIDKIFRYDPSLRKDEAKFIILFGAYRGLHNPFKGFFDLEKSIARLQQTIKTNCELRIFGEAAPDCFTAGVFTKFLGSIKSLKELQRIYHMADVFAFPSVVETQGMTKIEAMLCGLPVVAFDRAACAEWIMDGVTGCVVKNGDMEGFANSIACLYNINASKDSEGRKQYHQKIAEKAKAIFNEALTIESIMKVYGR